MKTTGALLLWLSVAAAPLLAQTEGTLGSGPAGQGGYLSDSEYAEQYEKFLDEVDEGAEHMVRQTAREYELDEDQSQILADAIADKADEFIAEYGMDMFDLKLKGEAMASYMRENRLEISQVDPEILRDIAEQAIPMMEGMFAAMRDVSEQLQPHLSVRQKALLARNMSRFEIGRRAAQQRLYSMAGRELPAEPQEADSGERGVAAGGDGRGGRRGDRGVFAIPAPPDMRSPWQRYVDRFCEEYAFQEMQKKHANDILVKYLDKLAQARKQREDARVEAATSRPTSQPDTQPADGGTKRAPRAGASARQFRERLKTANNDPAPQLLKQMIEELMTLPTETQKNYVRQQKKLQAYESAEKQNQ